MLGGGEPFVYLTDDTEAANRAATTVYRFPFHCGPLEVLVVEDANELMDDEFVFETLWYGRNSFVVNSDDRAEQMMEHFLERMQGAVFNPGSNSPHRECRVGCGEAGVH